MNLADYRPWAGSSILLSSAGVVETAVASDPVEGAAAWESAEARKLRYQVAWGLWEQNIFARLWGLAKSLKQRYDIYEDVRSIYSPGHRIGEFYAERLYPGAVDAGAGDGAARPSACPIADASPQVRLALAAVWRDSLVSDLLETWTRFGAVCGDAPLLVMDDPVKRKVYLRTFHPASLREFYADAVGNCRGYVIEERRPDPEWTDPSRTPRMALYTEVCYRSGDSVVYHTYRDGDDYDWRDYGASRGPRVGYEWSMPYGFVPMVLAKHRSIGFAWGAGEYYFSFPKLMELDALVSRLNDHIYKVAAAPFWLEDGLAGDVDLKDPAADPLARSDEPPPSKDRYPFLGGKGKPHALVVPLNVDHVTALAKDLLEKLEANDHPELIADSVGLSSSAESRKVARAKAEAQVIRRRANYDSALARAHMMALSIGGLHKYPGFEAFDLDSYRAGDLEHRIGERPVFTMDQDGRLDAEERRGKALKSLTDAGVPLGVAMRRCSFPKEEVREALAERDEEARAAVSRAVQMGFGDSPGEPADDAEPDPEDPSEGREPEDEEDTPPGRQGGAR